MCILEIVAALYEYTREPVCALEGILSSGNTVATSLVNFLHVGHLSIVTVELLYIPFSQSTKTQKDIFITPDLSHAIVTYHSLTKTMMALKC